MDDLLQGDARAGTGVPGLDDVLLGGWPRQHVFLVEGSPGTGKTTLALQFVLEGLRGGEKSLYIALSETTFNYMRLRNRTVGIWARLPFSRLLR